MMRSNDVVIQKNRSLRFRLSCCPHKYIDIKSKTKPHYRPHTHTQYSDFSDAKNGFVFGKSTQFEWNRFGWPNQRSQFGWKINICQIQSAPIQTDQIVVFCAVICENIQLHSTRYVTLPVGFQRRHLRAEQRSEPLNQYHSFIRPNGHLFVLAQRI